MDIKVPERNKRAGIAYAVTEDGIELPIIDVTHPAFAVKENATELSKLVLVEASRRRKIPDPIQRLYYRFFIQRSVLVRPVKGKAGSFMSAMSTYLAKLGPENLGDGYAKPIDRKLAGSLPFVAVRLRLHHMARLLAEGLAPILLARPGQPLHLLNIGGGPAMDSLNALIVLRKENPQALAGRKVFLHILDREQKGADFGVRALAALQSQGAVLHGLEVSFRYVFYDWSDVTILRQLLERLSNEGLAVAGSSEGGLFVYGSDEEVIKNLMVLKDGTPDDCFLVGSMSLSGGNAGVLNQRGVISIHARSVEEFEALVRRGGWQVHRWLEGPLGHNFSLEKLPGPAAS